MTIKQSEVVQGFVIKSTPYKERDALLQVYTLEHGKITIHARGIKNPKSKNRAACLSLTLSQFTIVYRDGISNLIKASILKEYRILKQDIELEVFASFILEYLLVMMETNVIDKETFHSVETSFLKLEQGFSPCLVYALFIAFILNTNGSALIVDGCCHCARNDEIVAISHSGGFVCKDCASKFDRYCDVEVLKAFRYINLCPIDQLDKLSFDQQTIKTVAKIMQELLDEFSGINFKTKKFIQQFI